MVVSNNEELTIILDLVKANNEELNMLKNTAAATNDTEVTNTSRNYYCRFSRRIHQRALFNDA